MTLAAGHGRWIALLVLPWAPPEEGEASAYRAVEDLFRAAQAEPEPPPGLRAPSGSERHRLAAERYAQDLATWREAEALRRSKLVGAAGEYLAAYPAGIHRSEVLYMRGVAHFEAGRHAEARQDLETFLASAPTGPAADAGRRALVEACRAAGDYRAALSHAGPDPEPDLIEEAGEIERAIGAAERAGDRARAAGWRLLGTRLDLPAEPPRGVIAVVVEAGVELPAERRAALRAAFGPETLGFLRCRAEQDAVYVLDKGGVIRAVNPRPDTLHHRISHLAATSAK